MPAGIAAAAKPSENVSNGRVITRPICAGMSSSTAAKSEPLSLENASPTTFAVGLSTAAGPAPVERVAYGVDQDAERDGDCVARDDVDELADSRGDDAELDGDVGEPLVELGTHNAAIASGAASGAATTVAAVPAAVPADFASAAAERPSKRSTPTKISAAPSTIAPSQRNG
jgi:hypothetical protein